MTESTATQVICDGHTQTQHTHTQARHITDGQRHMPGWPWWCMDEISPLETKSGAASLSLLHEALSLCPPHHHHHQQKTVREKSTSQLIYSDTWKCSYMEWQRLDTNWKAGFPSAPVRCPQWVPLNPAPQTLRSNLSGLGTLLGPNLERCYYLP